ncbi:GTPase Obg [Candidatus Deianiraea vastatrix]|uniref:GTPase Obg n=2 Tax=Candidatus Deianiraea vastatrix TaxID=2163644 RepID=A0A5B8XCN7_9RICK|nr:GTPase Obg [Candidatus Deianiraea vastatrix]
MFVDEAVVNIRAGNGGSGCCSFRREKFIPEGGPDGGNGGDGGSIIVIGDKNFSTLSKFKYQRHYIAQSGKSGSGRNKTGFSGEDIILRVPLGTQVLDYQTKHLIYDITEDGQKIVLAQGGRGGRGNATFKTSVEQAPRDTTPGGEGEAGVFTFRLKLFCDVGIIGLPNAGKSSLINALTNAKSAVGDYAFTTIKPVLGTIEMNYKQYVLADIPGLIKGASDNHGLGHQFLRHVERCKALIHLIDIHSQNPLEDYKIIRNELKAYNKDLAKKKEIIVFSKAEGFNDDELLEIEGLLKTIFARKKFIIISSFSGFNLELLEDVIVDLSN